MLITKIKNEKGKIITFRKRIANVPGEFHKKLNDGSEQEESEQEIGESENDVHDNNINEMTTESEQKTSKHATMRREKW